MDSRIVADRSVKRPSFDVEDLPLTDLSLAGHFAYDECQAEDVDQSGVSGQGTLRHVLMSRSSLADSRLTDLELMDVSLRNVILANASWEKVIARRAEMMSCQAVGLQLGLAKAEDLYLEDCKLDYARLTVEQRRGVIVFHRCTFVEAVLDGDLSGIVFSECEFRGAEFHARRAMRCDLTSSRLAGSSGLLTLVGAIISEEQVLTLSGQLATEAGFVIA